MIVAAEHSPPPQSSPDTPHDSFSRETPSISGIPTKISDISSESNPNKFQQLFLQFCSLPEQIKQTTSSNSTPKHSSPNTIIRIRIPPHTPKIYKVKRMNSEELNDSSFFNFPTDSLIKSPVNIPRPHTPNFHYPAIKRVITPEWDQSVMQGQDKNNLNDVECDDSKEENVGWNDLCMVDKHKVLETIESRIIWELDNEYLHPAQSINAANKGMAIVLSKDEYYKTMNYSQEKIKQIIPKFWEQRIWDNCDNILSEVDSLELDINIKKATTPIFSKLPGLLSSSSKKSLKRSLSAAISPCAPNRTKKIPEDFGIMSLPVGKYQTDDESSDWEDCF